MSKTLVQLVVDVIAKGGGNIQKVSKDLGDLDKAAAKAAIQQGVMAQRSQLLSRAQQTLSQRVLEGNLSVDKAAEIYQRYERSLPTVALDQLEKQTDQTTTGLQRIQDTFKKVAIASAAAGAAIFTAKKVFDFAEEGAQILQVEDSFDRMNETVFKTPGLLEEMRQAVRGTIGDTELMSGVLTLVAGQSDELARSLAEGAPKLLEIAKAAQKLNPTLGDTAFLYQSLSLGIKRQSKLIIDNLGLNVSIGQANERYAQSLGKTVEALTDAEKFQAFYNEVLLAGDKLIDQVGGNVDSLTDSYEATTVALKSYVEEAKKGLSQTLYNNVIGLKDTEQRWNDLREALIKSGASWGDINDIVDEGRAKLDLWRTDADLERDLKANELGIERMAFAIEALNKGLEIGSDEFIKYIDRQVKLNRNVGDAVGIATDYATALKTITDRVNTLRGMVEDGTITHAQFNAIFESTGFTARVNEDALAALEQQVIRNAADDEQFTEQLAKRQKQAERLAKATYELTEAQLRNQRALESSGSALGFYADKLDLNESTIKNLIRVYGDEAAAIEYLRKVMQDSGQVTDDIVISQADLEKQVEETTGAISAQTVAFRDVVRGGLTLFNQELDELGPKLVTIGGRTTDQNAILADAREEYKKLGAEIARTSAAPELYGLTAEEAAEKVGKLAERQGELLPLIERMEGVTGTASLAIQSATVNQEALNNALYDSLVANLDNTDAVLAYGLATGEVNEQQAAAILKEIELRQGIEALTGAYKDGALSVDQMKRAAELLGTDGLAAMTTFVDEAQGKLNPLNDALQNLGMDIPPISVEADVEPALTALAGLRTQLDEFLAGGVTMDEFHIGNLPPEDRAALESQVAELDQAIQVALELDVAGAQEILGTFKGELGDFTAAEYLATIDADTMTATQNVNDLETRALEVAEGRYELSMDAETTTATTAIGALQTRAQDVAGIYTLRFRIETEGSFPTPPGGQHGLNMVVPPGYPNDTFPILASSGERVIIEPVSSPPPDYRPPGRAADGYSVQNVYHIDARGAAPGVGVEIRQALEEWDRKKGQRSDSLARLRSY